MPNSFYNGEVVGGPVETIGPVNEGSARGSQVLVKQGDVYYVVSSVVVPFSGFETLIFPADAKGKVTVYSEVGGGRGITCEQAIHDLELEGPWPTY